MQRGWQQGKRGMRVADLEMCCRRTDVRLLVLIDRLAARLRRRRLLGAALVAHIAAAGMFLSVQKLPWNETGHRWHPNKRQEDRHRSEFAAYLHRS